MKTNKIVALGTFATGDSTGVVKANKGDIIEVKESTAVSLVKQGLAEKWRPKKKEGGK